jgi:hypothetical protein
MKNLNIFETDNKEWPCSIICGSSRSEFSKIFNYTNRETGTTYSYGYAFPHYYKMIIDILKRMLNFHQVSRRRRFFITSNFQILANKKYKK